MAHAWLAKDKMITKTKSRLTDQRTYFKPFNYPWAYDAWLKHEQAHWLHSEVPMAEDVKVKRMTGLVTKEILQNWIEA